MQDALDDVVADIRLLDRYRQERAVRVLQMWLDGTDEMELSD